MPVASVGAGLLAGILSTLSAFVFPLLPLVIGAATSSGDRALLAGGRRRGVVYNRRPLHRDDRLCYRFGRRSVRTFFAVPLVLLGLALLSSTIQARLGVAAGRLAMPEIA